MEIKRVLAFTSLCRGKLKSRRIQVDLKKWEEQLNMMLEEEIETFLEKNEAELFIESPLKSKKHQKIQSREELLKTFRLEDASDQIEKALIIIRDMLPQFITESEWNAVYEEFINCDEALISYFEAVENGEIDVKVYVSIAEMCGIGSETLKHCYELAQKLYEDKDYSDARALFGFLAAISPETPEFWISSGMSAYQLKNFQEAIELYKIGQQLFPENVAFYIHAANSSIADEDILNAKIFLEKAKALISLDSNCKKEWGDTYDFLNSRATNWKKQ